jgi:hypothetical protein
MTDERIDELIEKRQRRQRWNPTRAR